MTTFWEGDRDLPVVLRLEEQYRSRFEDAEDAYVVSTLTGARVPLRSVARVEPEWRAARIVRRNGLRTLTVMAMPDERRRTSSKRRRKKLPGWPFRRDTGSNMAEKSRGKGRHSRKCTSFLR